MAHKGILKYQLILLKNNERVKSISNHKYKKSVYTKFNKMINECRENVVFPRMFENRHRIYSVKYELAIIKMKESYESDVTKLKNEYGQYVDHVSDSEQWIVLEKEPYYFEEYFFAYGYNPKTQRKDFNFIYDNFVKKYKDNKYEFLNVWIYKNKVCFESASHMDMVLCKNKDDAIRMVNKIEEYAKRDKIKYILFSGDYSCNRKYSLIAIEKIQKLTNWNHKKILRLSTRP